jgi:hypothetical protein
MNQVSEEEISMIKSTNIIKEIVNKEGILSKEEKLKIISLSAHLQIMLLENIIDNETDKQMFTDSIKSVNNRLYK